MSHNIWRRWVSRLFKRRVGIKPRRKLRPLGIEFLEDRVVPATDSWTGGGGLANLTWSDAANWSLNRAPITGDNVVFNLAIASTEVINDNLTTNPILNSVTVSEPNYTLGKSGSSPLYISGSLNIGSGVNTIIVNQSLDFLPPPTTPQVSIGVNSGSTLDLTGSISAASNVTVSKTNPGTLILAGASTSTGWEGYFTLADSGSTGGGVVELTNSQSLGSTSVTINTNTQLQLVPTSGNLTFSNALVTNGSGVVGDGGLLNVSGNNTWSGPVAMDSDTTFGIDAGSQLTITGVISDDSTGHNLIKQGGGTLIFPGANTYRGDTTVDNGVLEIENPLSLGAGANALDAQSGSPQSETIVNDNPTDQQYGTLELNYNSKDVSSTDPNALLQNPNASEGVSNPVIGFQVFNDILVLNGPGSANLGALYNAAGDNEWDGSIILGGATPELANPTVNIATGTQLIASGVLSDPNQLSSLTKIGGGELVLSDANTYRGGTSVEAGILDISDSSALGTGSATVFTGAGLQLDVDSGFDGTSQRTHNRNLGFDSVTGSGPGQELDITGISGTFTLGLGGYSTPSINVASLAPAQLETTLQTDVNALLTKAGYTGQSVSSVTQDGSIYRIIFTNDTPASSVALMTATTTGGLGVAINPIYGLQVANSLTIEGPGISTGPDSGALNSDSGINVWTGPITLFGSAAIGVEADNQTDSVAYNQVVKTRAGHPLPDNDYLQWDYSLTVTGPIQNSIVVGQLIKTGLGNLILPNANTYGGTETTGQGPSNPDTIIQLGWITIENDNSLGYNEPPSNANVPQTLEPYVDIDTGGALQLDPQPGNSLILYNNFLVEGTGITSPTYGLINRAGAIQNLNGDNTLDGILQLEGTVSIGVEQIPPTSPNPPNTGFPGTPTPPLTASQLTLTGYLWNYTGTTGGLTKLGSRRLIIQGSGTYTGNVDVKDGVLLIQNNTALGAGNSTSATPPTVTVETGAAIELGNYVNGEDVGNGFISENGGIQSGVQVYGEHLILNGSGDPTFNDSALTVLASNNTVLGPTVQTVTVTGSSTGTYQLQYTYNGNTYATSPIAATAMAAQLQSIIDGILPSGGTVEVIQTGNVYTVTFGGTLLNATYSGLLLSATVPSPYTNTGAYAAVGTTEAVSGTTAVAPVNDPIVATDSIWRGPVTLADNTTVTVDTNSTLPSDESASRLIFEGSIGDDYPASAPSSLTILGGGEVDLNGTNTYSGTTLVQQGVVSIDNPSALGGAGVPEVQTLTLTNPVANSTKFVLTFNGFNNVPGVPSTMLLTQSVTYTGNATTDAANIASAIDAVLDSSGSETDGGGSVSVTETIASGTAKITVTFGGSLIGFPISQLGAALVPLPPASPPTTASVSPLATEVQAGAGGTIVENGASLEVAGSFSVSGEPLILEGNGTTQDIQSVTVPTGGATGTFTLTFFGPDEPGGASTPDTATLSLPDPNLAADMQAALEALSNIGGVGGTVTVTLESSTIGSATYYLSFGGSLSGENLETLEAFSALSGGSVSTAPIQSGSQTITGVPTQWFQAGPAPENNGQTGGNQPVSGEITTEAVDPNDPTVMYVGTAGGGVWKSIDSGNSWQPIFDAIPEIQTLEVSAGATGTFTLNFSGPNSAGVNVVDTTGLLSLSSPTLAGDIQAALDALSNIGGVGGQVTVSQSGNQFMITFNGTLAGATLSLLSVNNIALNGSITPQQFEQGMDPNFAIYVGAVAVDPENSNIIYVGTGVANTDADTANNENANNAFYGTGVYESTNGGLTWSLLLDDDSSPAESNPVTNTTFINPSYGMAVTGIAVDPETGGEASPTIYVSTGAVGGSVGDGVPNGGENGDANVSVTGLTSGAIQPGGTGQLAGVWRFSPDNAAGADPLGTWFCLTAVVSGARQVSSGQQSNPPLTPGPDDDFRIYFPEANVPNVVWTGVQVIDTGIANDGGEVGNAGGSSPVVYASLGTPGQYGGEEFANNDIWSAGSPIGAGVNAVYRCYDPDSTSPIWYIGDPGKPQDQVESITINDPSGFSADFTLSFNGYDTDSGGQGSGGLFPGTIGPMTYNVNFAQNVAGELQTNLDYLQSIGGVGLAVGNPGFVIVNVVSATATQTVFDVTFEGGLSDTPLPLIGVVNYTDQISSIQIAVVTPGGGVDTESAGEFPTYYIKASLNGNVQFSIAPGSYSAVDNVVIYASVPNSSNGNLLGIWESSTGGESWTELTTPPPEYMNGQGNYANAIVALNDGTVYVGGAASDLEDPTNMMYLTTDGGADWTNVSVDATVTGALYTPGTNTPHNAIHTIVADPVAIANQTTVIIGTDGGIWQLAAVTTTVAPIQTTYTWNDLNSNLATAMVDGVAAAQDNPGEMVVGAQGNGLAYFNGLLAWIESDQNGAAGMGPSGGLISIDPDNTNIIYAVLDNPPPNGFSSNFLVSNDGGKTWGPVASLPEYFGTQDYPYFNFLIDPLNANRLLIAGPDGLQQSLDGGQTWITLFPGNVTTVAVAGYQGVFVADPSFPNVSDIGANVDDPDTIYATDGSKVYVTKDLGLNWVTRTPQEFVNGVETSITGAIQSITVNPANRDNVFVVTQGTPGQGFNQVWESTDAGQDWILIGGAGSPISGLADDPIWQLVIDPRNGNLYVGTDIGVYELANAAPLTATGATTPNTTNPTEEWMRFGIGMPNVSVRILQLDLSTNTMIAGTYGRGVYQMFLDATETSTTPITAAIVGLSGNSFWAGPVNLVGDSLSNTVTVAADGTQGIPDGITAASINFVGPINDLIPGSNPTLAKTGDGDVIFSGDNIYGGQTIVGEGNLIADNYTALGLSSGGLGDGTTVVTGASLGLLANLNNETVTLNGDGLSFDGHFEGALRNVSGTNTFAGNVYLDTPPADAPFGNDTVTIDAETNSDLIMNGAILGGGGSGFTLVKEGTGTVSLDNTSTTPTSYEAATAVYRGALEAETSTSFGPSTNTVEVLDGAAVDVATPSGSANSTVISNPLLVSGTGINNTGALLDVGGMATWAGLIVFEMLPGFAPLALTAGTISSVAIGADAGAFLEIDNLTSNEGIQEQTASGLPGNVLPMGLVKVGPGAVALADANAYSGSTEVQNGVLDVQNASALGTRTTAGGLETIEQIVTLSDSEQPTGSAPVGRGGGQFTLSFDGKAATQSKLDFGASATAVLGVLAGGAGGGGGLFASAGFVGATVQVFQTPLQTTNQYTEGKTTPPDDVNGWVYTVIFTGGNNDFAQTPIQIQATGTQGTFATTSVVAAGQVDALVDNNTNGTGELELDNSLTSPSPLDVSQYTVTLNGDGPTGNGALYNLAGDNVWSGPIILATNSGIGVAAASATVPSSLTIPNVTGQAVENDGNLPAVPKLTKVAPGTLIIPSSTTYPTANYIGEEIYSPNDIQYVPEISIVQDGSLQVDATMDDPNGTIGAEIVGPIELAGGTVSGNGDAQSVKDQNANIGGTIDPGDNYPSETFGVFSSVGGDSGGNSDVTLSANDTYYVDLGIPASGLQGNNPPSPSNKSDVLDATTGTIDLGGATLSGLVDPLVAIGDAYTIINDPNGIIGEFANQGGTVTPVESDAVAATVSYIGGVKFEVDYISPANNGIVTRVDVIRELAGDQMSLSPSIPNPVYGQDEQFIATVTPETGAPPVSGTVVFSVLGPTSNAPSQYDINLVNGVATLDLPASLDGPPIEGGAGYTVSASYSGYDANNNDTFEPSSASAPTVSVAPATVSTKLVFSYQYSLPQVYGAPFAIDATVSTTVASPVLNTLAPAGSVSFYDGTTLLETVQLSQPPAGTTSAVAVLNSTMLSSLLGTGNHTIYGLYNPDPNYLVSSFGDNYTNTSPPSEGLVGLTIQQDKTSTTVSASPTSAVTGQSGVVFTATVTPASPGSGDPTGTLIFKQGSVVLGYGTLSATGGVTTATYTSASGQLLAGSTPITAVYNGDANFTGSTGSTSTFSVSKAATGVLLSSSDLDTPYGQAVTFTADVAPTGLGGGIPTGAVTFWDAATNSALGAGSVNSNGIASYTTTNYQLPAGSGLTLPTTQNIYAVYGGDANYTGNTSNTIQQTITQAVAAVSVSTSGASVYGQPVTVTATVTPTNPGGVIPTGTVAFFLGSSIVSGVDLTVTGQDQVQPDGYTAQPSDVGEFVAISGAGWNQGVYEILSEANGIWTLNGSPAAVGTTLGQWQQYGSELGSHSLGTTLGVTSASYTTGLNQLPVGTNQTITAVYSGDLHYSLNTGTGYQTVNQDSTTTTLTSSGPVLSGQSATLIAQVSSNSPGGGTPTGSVTFTLDGVTLGAGPVSLVETNGVTTATISVPASDLAIGPNTITASYSGDSDFIASTASLTEQEEDKTATALTTSLTPAVYGEPVTLTATITPANGAAITPTGTVTFMSGSTTLGTAVVGTVTLNGNPFTSAELTVTNIPTGANQTIDAFYSGDSTFVGSEGAVVQTVIKDTTKTTVSSTATSVENGQVVIFSAQVVAVAPGEGSPTGTVTFKRGSTTIGTGTLTNGVATLQTTMTVVGRDSITAVYGGDANDNTSTSAALIVTVSAVGARASKVTLTSSLNPSDVGQAVTFTATVVDAGGGAAHTPTGTISFFNGTTLLGYGALSGSGSTARATFTTSALPLGTSSIMAQYNGSGTFARAKSAVLTQTVNALAVRPSDITLSQSIASSTYGEQVAFTATVNDLGTGAAETPTGTVTFFATNTTSETIYNMGTGTLVSGVGSATTTVDFSILPVGQYTISASYSGDGAFEPEATDTTTPIHAVNGGASGITLVSSLPSGSVYGQAVTFTATVSVSGSTTPAAGQVQFINETTGTILGTVTLSNTGVASLKTAALIAGNDIIEALYMGNANVTGNWITIDQSVSQDATAIKLATTETSNSPVTLTATVAAVAPGGGVPTGTVSFYIDGSYVGAGTINSSGVATFTDMAGVSTGKHTVEAVYNGDENFSGNSVSETVPFTIGRGT